jgi:uncharacterized cofD-like protein
MKPIGTEPEALLEALVLNQDGPNVVAIGGGHGLAQALLAVQRYAGRIDAVVTVADDGGSSGRLAPALDIPPPGDIRQCLIALTPDDSVWRRLFRYRFSTGDVEGHSLGNLIIGALSEIEGSFEAALRSSERLLGAAGRVLPASPLHLRLEAVVDGETVAGQAKITRTRGTFSALRVLPADAAPSESVLEAIAAADHIVLGPGSLYTSLMAVLVVPGIADAINQASARLTYVSNLYTQDGETLGMDAADHLEALLHLTGVRPPGAIVANQDPVQVPLPLEAVRVDGDVIATYGVDVIEADLLDRDVEWPSHDPDRLGEVLEGLHFS